MLNFVLGPMMWLSVGIFIVGMMFRIKKVAVQSVRNRRLKRTAAFSLKRDIRPVQKNISLGQRLFFFKRFVFSERGLTLFISVVFHVLLFGLPIFLTAHNIMLETFWGVSLFGLDERLADILTFVFLACCLFFLGRRLLLTKVRSITTRDDYFILLVAVVPFLTGVLAYHQLFDYNFIMIVHILSGQLMLVAIPFSKLIHMIVFFLNRSSFISGIKS